MDVVVDDDRDLTQRGDLEERIVSTDDPVVHVGVDSAERYMTARSDDESSNSPTR